jgi:chromatin segregation and condensation protein Rec8/ScpA/Scc1 (kleisin family)
MTKKGWSSAGLELVGEDDRLWTVDEAARFLEERPEDLRWLIRRLNIPPVGTRRPDRADKRGRQPRVYRAIDFIKAYDALSKAA